MPLNFLSISNVSTHVPGSLVLPSLGSDEVKSAVGIVIAQLAQLAPLLLQQQLDGVQVGRVRARLLQAAPITRLQN